MNVILYKYLGERNRIDKSSQLQQVYQTSGSFKGDTSVLSPTLLLSLPIESVSRVTDGQGNRIDDVIVGEGDGSYLDFNYLYIQEFRRYYYVNSIVVSSDTLIIVSCEVDPLYSFKDQILANTAIVERNEFDYSPFLEDSLLPLNFRKTITETIPQEGDLVNTRFYDGIETSSSSYVVSVVCDKQFYYSPIDPPANTNLPKIAIEGYTATGSYNTYCISSAGLRELANVIIKNDTLLTHIRSIVALPFQPLEVGQNNDIFYGHYNSWNDTGNRFEYRPDDPNQPRSYVKGNQCKPASEYQIVADFRMPKAYSFLDFAPYKRYELYLPFYGYTELDFNSVSDHRLIVFYNVDYLDGSGNVTIYDVTQNKTIFSTGISIGVKIGLDSTNMKELSNQRIAENTNLALNLIASIGAVAGGVASANPIAVAGGALSAGRAVASYVNSSLNMFQRASIGYSSPLNALYSPMKVKLRVTRQAQSNNLDWDEFAHQFGRPLRGDRLLSSLSGFTMVSKIHLEGCTATDIEKSSIESSLLQGVII